ncbi:MAG TPA: hypothetical protein VGI43_02495 [Mucilaginibacter sp.]|jgi:NADH:ubiquinone oxidoreductase subunit E
MERIVLEVDNSLAKAWKNSSPELRATYENRIIDVLKELQEKEPGLTEEQLEIINQMVQASFMSGGTTTKWLRN